MRACPLIVVLVPEGPGCGVVLGAAAGLAERCEGMVLPVRVMRVFSMVGTPGFLPPQPAGVREAVFARAAQRVREAAGPLAERRLRLLQGDPVRAVAVTAREVGADLVVVGYQASWRGVVARRRVRRLLGRCRVPVLAVPVAGRDRPWVRRLREVFSSWRGSPADRELARLLAGRPPPPGSAGPGRTGLRNGS